MLDVLMSTPILILLAAILLIGIPPLANKMKAPESLLMLAIVTGLASVYLLPPLHEAYQALRIGAGGPPTWETARSALDFSLGYIFLRGMMLLSIMLPLMILSMALGTILRLTRSGNADTIWGIALGLIGLLACGLYFATFFGKCSFYSVDAWFQSTLFGSNSSPLALRLTFEAWFGNPCGVLRIDAADIISHPISASRAYSHLEAILREMHLGDQLARVLSPLIPWLGLAADILSIYMFLESRMSRRKRDAHR